MNKKLALLVLLLLMGTCSADRWSNTDYERFCAEYARQVYGGTYSDYYNTSQTNATKCVLYHKRGFPDDFYVKVPKDITGRDRCVHRADCPARVWSREWFDLAMDQNSTEDQVCGMCVAVYYAMQTFSPYLDPDATWEDAFDLLLDYSWIEPTSTPTNYCVDGKCSFSCMRDVQRNVQRCEARKDAEWMKVLDNNGIKYTEKDGDCADCPPCPSIDCPECECRVCPECDECEECPNCEYSLEDINSKNRIIRDLNEELISCRESGGRDNITLTNITNDNNGLFKTLKDYNSDMLYWVGAIVLLVVVYVAVIVLDRMA